MLLHVSICSKLVRNFSNTLVFVSLCRYASLLNYDIFIQPGTPSNWSKCQMYNNNENWSYFVSDILIYLGKSLKIISLFPQNLGVQRRPFFVLGASQDAWTPFWLIACLGPIRCCSFVVLLKTPGRPWETEMYSLLMWRVTMQRLQLFLAQLSWFDVPSCTFRYFQTHDNTF
jgi:hypothetical protein